MNFTIKLSDQFSGPSKNMGSASKALEAQIKSEKASLAKLEDQFRSLNKASVVDIQTAKRMRDSIQGKKDSIGELTEKLINSGSAAKEAATAEQLLGVSAGTASAIVGAMVAVIAALAVGAVAAAGAVAYLATNLVKLGVAASEARDDVERSLEVTYRSQKGAESTYKAIVEVTNRVAISQERAIELSDSLIKAGELNGPRMVKSIEAVGKAEAARAGAGKTVEGILTRAHQNRVFSVSRGELRQIGLTYRDLAKEISKGAGMAVSEAELRLRTGTLPLKRGVKALQDVIETKLADIADRKLVSVGHQSTRLRDNIKSLFSTFDTGPFGRMLKTIADLFDENIKGGETFRTTLKTAFDEIGKAVEAVRPYVELFFLGMQLMAAKVLIALFPIRKALRDLGIGGGESLATFEDAIIKMSDVVAGAIGYVANVTAGLIRDWKILVQLGKDVAGVFEKINPGAAVVGKLVGKATGEGIKASRDETEARDRGLRVAAGLTNGIEAGTPAAVAAMERLAKLQKERYDRALGIHSPSKVMRVKGRQTGEGTALGLEDSEPRVIRAASRLADSTVRAGSPGAAPGQSPAATFSGQAKGKLVEVNFHPGAIVLSSGKESFEELKDKMTEIMTDVFEQAALLQGTG